MSALEPDRVLSTILAKNPGIETLAHPIEALKGREFDAVVAESVLYALDLPSLLPQVATLLRKDGDLVLCDMVWTERVSQEEAARIHDASLRQFGIACASRPRWTWADWRSMLEQSGFDIVREERLGTGSPGSFTATRPVGLAARLSALPHQLRQRLTRGIPAPNDAFESWLCHVRRR